MRVGFLYTTIVQGYVHQLIMLPAENSTGEEHLPFEFQIHIVSSVWSQNHIQLTF